MRIGLAKSRGFVLASTFPEIYRRDNPDLLDQVDDQWKSSLCRAIIAREIAKNTRFASADEVYACALITSCVPIAKLYMSRESRELVRAVGVREEVALALCLGRTALWPEEWICSAAGVLLDTKLSRSLVLAEMLNTGNLTDAQSATALDEETLEQGPPDGDF
jgi:hypothetical protein